MAFKREKPVKGHSYHYLVENTRQDGRIRQRILQYWGRAGESPVTKAYRDNIGPVTPIIAEELSRAERQWPDWIMDAIREAVVYDKLSLAYILKILEAWQERGGPGRGELETPTPADGKFAFDSAPHVRVTEEEVLDLVKRFSNDGAAASIDVLSQYKESTGKKYASDYATILLWHRRGNPWDGTEWNPEPQGWEINQQWLDSLQPKPALQPAGGFGNNNARGPRTMTQVTCRKCGRQFNAVVPKDGVPRDVCQKCVRAEGDRLSLEERRKRLAGLFEERTDNVDSRRD